MTEPTSLRFRLIGLLPLVFFLAQTVHYWRYGGLSHLAWMCNVGNLLMAIGIFINHKELIRATAIWTVPGLAIWFWYVWLSGSTAITDTEMARCHKGLHRRQEVGAWVVYTRFAYRDKLPYHSDVKAVFVELPAFERHRAEYGRNLRQGENDEDVSQSQSKAWC